MCAVAFNKGKLKMLATSADSNLGGRDFDRLLATHFANEFKSRYKVKSKLLSDVLTLKNASQGYEYRMKIVWH